MRLTQERFRRIIREEARRLLEVGGGGRSDLQALDDLKERQDKFRQAMADLLGKQVTVKRSDGREQWDARIVAYKPGTKSMVVDLGKGQVKDVSLDELLQHPDNSPHVDEDGDTVGDPKLKDFSDRYAGDPELFLKPSSSLPANGYVDSVEEADGSLGSITVRWCDSIGDVMRYGEDEGIKDLGSPTTYEGEGLERLFKNNPWLR